MERGRFATLLVLLGALCVTRAFYLPGVAPTEYIPGSVVSLKVNKLTSVQTQLPYRYYYLPYCQPREIKESVENLGEILTGDVIENSNYQIKMLEDSKCTLLCTVTLTDEEKTRFKDMIEDDYIVNWLIDNLPNTLYEEPKPKEAGTEEEEDEEDLINGFLVGMKIGDKYYLNNHVDILLKYHINGKTGKESYRIVGFEVAPRSIVHENDGANKKCPAEDKAAALDLDSAKEISFTYSVTFSESNVKWASRWDAYLLRSAPSAHIHWFSIVNSLLIVLFLSGMVATILLRTLLRDISNYNQVPQGDEAQEETGWKLVHGDVFRKPPHSQILACFAGSGIQVLGMTMITIVCAMLGFLSPAQRGVMLQAMLLLFTFMGFFAGYTSARFYKMFKGENWKRTTLLTAFLFPGVCFSVFFGLDLAIWAQGSSGAVPFSTMFAILCMWFGISTPLVFLGAYLGYSAKSIEHPVRTNQIPRQVPTQPWFVKPFFTCLLGGILPYGAVFTELFFLLTSMWNHQFYYLFGFLFLILLILIVTCAEIAITLTYFQLSCENYNWWWRSFFTCAFSGIYVFIYAIYYFFTRLNIRKAVSIAVYFGYMGLLSYAFFILTGTVGFIASFIFVKAIYGSIKID